ncbi:chorismate mutase [Streptomyces pactum]|uniref:Chorismate mutase n=1 Tax=Streptomyces pactum TaxID=68249 RepID=A0ABS0NMP4_9ACTN|nr:chorismate mutase [Streptomyces pactum]MBH5336453.1 chorismate mutase [Streptomyces pactum]
MSGTPRPAADGRVRTAPATDATPAPAGPTSVTTPGAPTDATSGAATAPGASAAASGVPTTGIPEGRAGIDRLDGQIIALIQERMAVSAGIQRSRLASGGRRVDLTREMEILGRYREALGKPGTTLAMTLLELCRGRA